MHKYAFGLDPTRPTPLPVQAQRAAMLDGSNYLTITFPQAFGGTDGTNGSYTYNGVTYQVRWSSDLINWSGTGVQVISSADAPGYPSGYRMVAARAPVPITAAQRQFMRVVVTGQ